MMYEKNQHWKMIVSLVLLSFCLMPTVSAIGLSPLSLDITVEKETEIVRKIEVTNPSENPIHIIGSITGSVEQFITLEPEEFDLAAGPGIMNPGTRPSKYVTVKFNIPREFSERTYTGEIVFTQQPVEGGTLGTAAQLGVPVKLMIGKIEKAEGKISEAEFPLYINILIVILILTLTLALIAFIYKRGENYEKEVLTSYTTSSFRFGIST